MVFDTHQSRQASLPRPSVSGELTNSKRSSSSGMFNVGNPDALSARSSNEKKTFPPEKQASMVHIVKTKEANKEKRMGGGAIVSFPLRYVHPKSVRDAAHPDRTADQMIVSAGVIKQVKRSIWGEKCDCVLIHHQDFKDENGEPTEVWVKKSHCVIQKEGNPEMFY